MLRSMSSADPQPLVLLVAADIPQFGLGLRALDHLGRPELQFLGVGVFQRVLELGAADPGVNGEILHRLHEERDPAPILASSAAAGG